MGTDIHFVIERRVLTPKYGDTVMRKLERQYHTGDLPLDAWELAHTISWQAVEDEPLWDGNRNYELFSVIGLDMNRGGSPLEGRFRGIPKDATIDWDDSHFFHSQTWYMCAELVDVMQRMMWHSTDALQFQQMNRNMVTKYGPRDVRIVMAFDS